MKTFTRYASLLSAVAVLTVGSSAAHAASLYLSAVAETTSANPSAFAPAAGHPVSYVAVDAGYINSGDPVGGIQAAPPPLIQSAMAQALAKSGFQPAPAGTTPALLIVYSWGEIRHDSMQLQPTNHLKGNDRARLLLVSRASDANRIEQDIVNDRFSPVKVGAMVRTEPDREALQLSHDDLCFFVVSAYDMAALREPNRQPVWRVKLSTRAIGHTMSDELVSLIQYGAPYFGRNESTRQDLKETLVSADSIAAASPVPGLDQTSATGASPVQEIVRAEHDMWSGKFPND